MRATGRNAPTLSTALLILGCSSPDTTTASSSGAAASAPTASAVGASSTAPPPSQPGSTELAALPRGAAFYLSVRTPLLDDLLALAPDPDALRRELDMFPDKKGSLADLAAQDGIARDRPMLLVWMPPDIERARTVFTAVLKGDALATPDAEPAIASHIRVILPWSDAVRLDLDAVAKGFKDGKVDKCPGDPLCQTIGGTDLVAVLRHESALGSVRRRGNVAQLDLTAPIFVEPSHPSVALALRDFASAPLGGPESPRCRAMDAAAGASACVDADRMAEVGTAMGWGNTVRAISGAGIDAASKKKILEQGDKESRRNLELAAPQRRLLDDGTVTLTGEANGVRATMSWELTEGSRALRGVFAKERCAAGADFIDKVANQLPGLLGDRGADFARPAERLAHVTEAGFAAYPILAARTWPNFLSADLLKQVDPADPRLARVVETCVRARDGRLEVSFVLPKTPR